MGPPAAGTPRTPQAEAEAPPGSIILGDRILTPSQGAQLAIHKVGPATAFLEVYSDGRPPSMVAALGPPGPQLQALQAALGAQSQGDVYLITSEQIAAAMEAGKRAAIASKR